MPQNNPIPVANAGQIEDAVKAWLNSYESKPTNIAYEFLRPDAISSSFSPLQAPYKIRQYITGGYKAQFQFRVIYRVEPATDAERIAAAEALNALGTWAVENPPTLSDAVNVKVEQYNTATIVAAYDDGSVDYALQLTLTYEVI